MTRASGTELALGIEAARRALLHGDDTAEELYREAIERLGHTRIRVELARAQLLYGEWLRREGRRADARAQLRTAHEALAAMGVEAFADRARHELAATGETVRKHAAQTSGELTAQEAHIARLAAKGSPALKSSLRCTSAREPSNGTSARSSPSSGSAPGASCGGFPMPTERACPARLVPAGNS